LATAINPITNDLQIKSHYITTNHLLNTQLMIQGIAKPGAKAATQRSQQ
jgi:hypothetical protein